MSRLTVILLGALLLLFAGTIAAQPDDSSQPIDYSAADYIPQTQRTSTSPTDIRLGPQPYLTIPCKFADIADEPQQRDYFWGKQAILDSYWQESSYGLINLSGSDVMDWVQISEPLATFTNGYTLEARPLFNACYNAAKATRDISGFVGYNIMLNGIIPYNFGGTFYESGQWLGYTLNRVDHWQNRDGWVKHEMGHTFGLPHSGSKSWAYNNQYDIMGAAHRNQHTNQFYKYYYLGWIPESKAIYVEAGESRTVTLERATQPTTDDALLVVAPRDPNNRTYYTFEARKKVGFDAGLEAEGVIIHDMSKDRVVPAYIYDADFNENTADDGVIWLPGERFVGEDGITMCVESASETGYTIKVGNQVEVWCGLVSAEIAPSFQQSTTAPVANATIDYTLTLQNSGATLENATVNIALPHRTTLQTETVSATSGTVGIGDTIQINLANLPVGHVETITFGVIVHADVAEPTPLTATAFISGDVPDQTLTLSAIANAEIALLPIITP